MANGAGDLAWLLVAVLLLGGGGLWLWTRGGVMRRSSGVPRGRIVYRDTGDWQRCEEPLFSARYGLAGRPDYLVRQGAETVPVEVKSGAAPSGPYRSHLLQLAAYCLLVEETEGRRPPYGMLRYADRTFEVDFTPALRRDLLQALDQMRAGLHAPQVHRDHHDAARCRGCGVRSQCRETLA